MDRPASPAPAVPAAGGGWAPVLVPVPLDGPRAQVLLAELEADLGVRYGRGAPRGSLPPGEFRPPAGRFLVAVLDGADAGCAGVRLLADSTAEVKRMFVRPQARGQGVARALLGAVERDAVTLGARRMLLETGTGQPEAMRLYESSGYRPVPGYGEYAHSSRSRAYAKPLTEVDTGDDAETARLTLRRPDERDVGVVLRLHQDQLAVAHNPGDTMADAAAARERLRHWAEHWALHRLGYWAVCWRADPAVLGFCGVKVMGLHGRPVSNLFYRLDPAVWGRGIATEAATAAVGRAVRRRPDRPVVARVRPGNLASARVAVAAGLTRAPELDVVGEDGPEDVYALPASVAL